MPNLQNGKKTLILFLGSTLALMAQTVGTSQGPRCFPPVYTAQTLVVDSLRNASDVTLRTAPPVSETRSVWFDATAKALRVDISSIDGSPTNMRRYYLYGQNAAYEYVFDPAFVTFPTCKRIPMSGSGNQVCFAPLAPLPFTPHASAPPPAPAGTLSVPAIEVDRAKYQEVMGDYLRRTFWAPYEWRVFSDVRSSEISYQVARVGFYLIPISITERPFVVSAPSPIPIGSTSCPQGHLSFDPLIGYTCKTFTYGRFERFLNVTPSTVPLPSYVFALPATCSLL